MKGYERQFGYERERAEHELKKEQERKRLEFIEKGYFPKRKKGNVPSFKVGG